MTVLLETIAQLNTPFIAEQRSLGGLGESKGRTEV